MPFGSFLLTASWLNLTTYLKRLPWIGMFFVMFKTVFFTVFKLALLVSVLLVAFGLGFHVMLHGYMVSSKHNKLNRAF